MDGRTWLLAISLVQYASGLRLDLTQLGARCRWMFRLTARISPWPTAHKWLLGPEGCAVFYVHARAWDQLRLQQ